MALTKQQEIDKLKSERDALLNRVNSLQKVTQGKQQLAKSLRHNYGFFRSSHPGCTYILSDGTSIVFEAQSRIISRDPTTNKVDSEETWGQFFTRSPELIQELKEACRNNKQLRPMNDEEVSYVIESIQQSSFID